jgi:hypothetical protein
MNAFTASDLEAAGLLALARLDDGGAPCPQRPATVTAWPPGQTMIAAAPPASGPGVRHPACPCPPDRRL